LRLTELPHLRKRREEKRREEKRRIKGSRDKGKNVNGRRRGSERANFWEPVVCIVLARCVAGLLDGWQQ